MKNFLAQLLIVFLLSIIAKNTAGQSFNNEWIDYDKTYLKVLVDEDGVYRLPYDLIKESFPNNDPNGFKLINNGEEVPIYLSNNNELTDNDYIEFIGYKNDGTFDTQLYKNPDWQLDDKYSLFTDDNAYYLTNDISTENLRYTLQENIENNKTPEKYFTKKEHLSLAQEFFVGKPDTLLSYWEGGGYPKRIYYSHFGENEGFSSTIVFPQISRDFDFETKNILQNEEIVQIEIKLLGRSNDTLLAEGDHHTVIKLNDSIEIADVYFDGYNSTIVNFEIPANKLSEINTFTFTSVADSINHEAYYEHLDFGINVYPNYPIGYDRISIVYISISYPHSYNFSDEKNYKINLQDSGAKYLNITPENESSQTLIAYDLTYAERIELDKKEENFELFLADKNKNRERSLLVYDPEDNQTYSIIDSIETITFIDYTEESKQGEFIIITHPSLRDHNNDQVQRYADYRASQAGGNYKVQVVNIEELYEQFAFGIEKNPLAIKNYLNYIVQKWAEKPKHILLLGKAIRYNRVRSFASVQSQCLIPTYGTPGSDFDLVSTSVHSPVNQISIGRLSVLNDQDIKTYLNKLIEYEANLKYDCNGETIPNWMSNILHLNSGAEEQETTDIKIITDNFLQQLNEKRWKTQSTSFQSNGVNFQPADLEVYDVINSGVGLLNYYGYSNGEFWKLHIQTDDLNNQGKYPIILSSSAFVGDIFKTPNEISPIHSIDIIFTENKGAIAYYGGKAFSIFQFMEDYNLKLYKNISNKDYGKTLGEIIQNVNTELYDENNPLSQFYSDLYTYHGDPAIRFAHHPKPDFQASDESISIFPSEISKINEPITLNLNIINPGRYQTETLQVDIEKIDENGIATFIESININIEKDSASLNYTFPPNTFNYGENTIGLHINANETATEYCYENNLTFIPLNIEEDTNIEDIKAKINIFPNPVSENLNINAVNITKIELHSLDGKQVKEWHFQNQSNASIEIADISTGIYLLKIKSNSKIITRKITVN